MNAARLIIFQPHMKMTCSRLLTSSLFWIGMLLAGLLPGARGRAASTNDWPAFEEVYSLVRSNAEGLTDAELNRAAVSGLVQQLQSRVVLGDDEPHSLTPADAPRLAKTAMFDHSFAYFRVRRVGPGLAEDLTSAFDQFNSTNKLKGLIFDLRYAGGWDYAAAAKVADAFVPVEKTLLKWGPTSASSTLKTNAITLPVMVLVNQETAGASEALAAILRHADVALLIGGTTAGKARLFKEFTLSTGQSLRIAATPVLLGDGKAIAPKGLSPDIRVFVSDTEERAFYEDAYRIPPSAQPLTKAAVRAGTASLAVGTNPPPRRINEAELVRMQREGLNPDLITNDLAVNDLPASKPLVRDPALARALDLLKGLAVVQQSRAP